MPPVVALEPALERLVAVRTDIQHGFGLLDVCLDLGHELAAQFHHRDADQALAHRRRGVRMAPPLTRKR